MFCKTQLHVGYCKTNFGEIYLNINIESQYLLDLIGEICPENSRPEGREPPSVVPFTDQIQRQKSQTLRSAPGSR